MANFTRFEKLAKAHNLKVVVTTTDGNGYPCNEGYGLIGFESYEHLKKFAEAHRMEEGLFWQKNGWRNWCVGGLDEEDLCIYNRPEYGEMSDYRIYRKSEIEDLEASLKYEIETEEVDEDDDYIKYRRELIEELRKLEDGQVLVYDGCNGDFEIDYEYSIAWNYDSKRFVIGAC